MSIMDTSPKKVQLAMERDMMITKPDDFYGKIDFDDELEQQYWKEQPPYPFATPEELEELKKNGKL